ncbi:MAG TPA: heme-binding protein [Pyrinomonadaceae bacterium]|nr:heme-binding protein [Pyrinomonadaceae bacterium]
MPSSKTRTHRRRLLVSICAAAAVACVGLSHVIPRSGAQEVRPVLVSEPGSTRAVALESVSRLHEPFGLQARHVFGSDRRTRVQVFALNLGPEDGPANITADAEDGAGRVFPLAVEHVGPVPGEALLYSVTLRLHDEMSESGDVLVRIRRDGVASNRVRVGIGRVGGGPADDLAAEPAPGLPRVAPTPNNNPVTAGDLSADDVRNVISQAVSAAVALNRAVTVAVTDKEGNVLGVFRMTGASTTSRVAGGGTPGRGLEGADLPTELVAISKAGTSSFFGTQGNAFTPRTASFIVQEHFPPRVEFQPGGPLYGVQFSSLPCTDVKFPALPLGLSADPGSVPLYKNGVHAGGVGVEADGIYGLDKDPRDFDKPVEEIIAVAAGRGYEPPATIRADNIIVGGIRLPYVNVANEDTPNATTIAFASLPGSVLASFPVRPARPSAFVAQTVGGVNGQVDLRFFPFIGSPTASPNRLTAADVGQIIAQAARQADITRAAIRQPLGSPARVSMSVVDVDGNVLGIFRTQDAPVFGFDVSAQKARGAVFFSRHDAGAILRSAGLGAYVDRGARDGVNLDGSIAFAMRGFGFLHRPFYPDGINPNPAGPFSTEIGEWSIFNVGLQLDIIRAGFLASLPSYPNQSPQRCAPFPQLANGTQIFAGGVPLFKGGELVGAIGISGDGIDQDDLIAAAGSNGFTPPVGLRSDQFVVRDVRLPFVKFPRSPNL